MIERLRVQILAGAVGEFSSPESTLCADSYSVSVPPPCYRSGTLKKTQSFDQKCIWQVTPKHAYSLDPSKSEWADHAATQEDNLSGNELLRNSSGNTRLQSSQLAEPLWTDPGLMGGISVHELISTLKKKKKHRWGMNCQTFSQNSHTRWKSHHKDLFPQLTVSDVTDNLILYGLTFSSAHCVWCHW